MEIFLIDVHSFSDVITNSSTDVFAFKTEKSVESIKELLENLLKVGSGIDISSVFTVSESTIESFYNSYNDWLNYDKITLDEFVKRFTSWKGKKGKQSDRVIVVKGVEDNSIPHWLQEYIEDLFSAYRIHLG